MINSPKAFIFAGANASGKSTYITHLLKNDIINGEYINPDNVLAEKRLDFTKENYIKIAFPESDKRRIEAIKGRKDIIIETVFSTPAKVELITELSKEGYHITLFFTGTNDVYTNVIYLTTRVLKGGHDVPISRLIERRKSGFNNIRLLYNKISCLILVDNSVAAEAPVIVKSLYKGQLCYAESNIQREASWIAEVTPNEVLNVKEKMNIEIVNAHKQFCDVIQDSIGGYSDTIEMSYGDKNSILSSTGK